MRKLLWALAALITAVPLLAQGGSMGMPGGQTVVLNTTKGLFVLRGNALAKYGTAPLKQANLLQLPGKGQTTLLEHDGALLAFNNDKFLRINEETLQIDASADLAATTATTNTNAQRLPQSAPSYLLVDNTLYLVTGAELLAVNLTTAQVSSRLTLAKELQATQQASGRPGGWGMAGNAGNGMGRGPGGNDGGDAPPMPPQ